MSSLTVGLTGGLASGKSTVADWLRQAGHTVIDADRLVAGLYAPGQAGARAVGRLFGDKVLTAEGSVDHRRLAALVFDDAAARQRLETAIHPLVGDAFRRTAAATEGVAVLEATLLIEAGLASDFDLVVAVEAEAGTRIARAAARGMSEDDARNRLVAQSSDAWRHESADRVLDNNGDLGALRHQVDALLDEIDRRAAANEQAADDDE